MSGSSWRLFLIEGPEKTFRALGFGPAYCGSLTSGKQSPEPTSVEGVQKGEIIWAESSDLKTLESLIDFQIPEGHDLHILTTTVPELHQQMCLRERRAIYIPKSALPKDYARLDAFLNLLSEDRAQCDAHRRRIIQENCADERTCIRKLRPLIQSAEGLKFAEEIFAGRPDYLSLLERARGKAKLLLHVCCGPDAGGVIRQLKSEFDLSCFWYDPNIQPKAEYDRRLEAFQKVASIEGIPAIIGSYDVDEFFERIRGLEHTPEQGAKCSQCYDMRLEHSAIEAAHGNFEAYATTLAISPHKVQEKLIKFGKLNEKRLGVPYYHRNFMKEDGFKNSVTYSREHGIYRQDYCGCLFSLHEGGPEAQKMARELQIYPNS